MDTTVLVEVRDGVATLTLNNAPGGNILDMAMGRHLLEAALRVEGDPAVRAVVVTGAGQAFLLRRRPAGHGAAGGRRRCLPE